MSTKKITFEDVARAANKITEEGGNVTIWNVRSLLNDRGSVTTISKYLNDWRSNPEIVKPKVEQVTTPDPVQKVVNEVWANINKETESKINSIKNDLTLQNKELQSLIHELTSQNYKTKSKVDKLTNENKLLQSTLENSEKEIANYKNNINELKISLKFNQESLEDLTKKFEKNIKILTDSFNKNIIDLEKKVVNLSNDYNNKIQSIEDKYNQSKIKLEDEILKLNKLNESLSKENEFLKKNIDEAISINKNIDNSNKALIKNIESIAVNLRIGIDENFSSIQKKILILEDKLTLSLDNKDMYKPELNRLSSQILSINDNLNLLAQQVIVKTSK